jgi:hypothetical protein
MFESRETHQAARHCWSCDGGRRRGRTRIHARSYSPLSVRPFSSTSPAAAWTCRPSPPAAVLQGLLRHQPPPRIRGQRRLHTVLRYPRRRDEELLTSGTELIPFGFRFLKQVQFGENTIEIHEEAAAKRRRSLGSNCNSLEPRLARQCGRRGWDV